MIRSIVNLTVCFALISWALMSQAQRVPQQAGPESTTCLYNFNSGTNNTFLNFCVTATGNIMEIETPKGHEQLIANFGTDGYGICNESPATVYFDYGIIDGDSGNWGSPTLLNQTATSVKIARTTSDGIWTLTQTITLVPATPAIKIAMALKNNTAAPRKAYLIRWADINADFSGSNDFSATRNTAAGWTASIPFSSTFGFGLQLQNSGNSQFGFVDGFSRTTFHGPNPCNFAADSSGTPLVNVDGSIALAYVEAIGANKSKTATMLYRGM